MLVITANGKKGCRYMGRSGIMGRSGLRSTMANVMATAKQPPVNMTRIKKGGIMLLPMGDILRDDETTQLMISKSSKGIIHDAMIPQMLIKVVFDLPQKASAKGKGKGKAKRTTEAEGECLNDNVCEYKFLVRSPLFAGKVAAKRSECTKSLAPFWGLLTASRPKTTHNMEMKVATFRDAAIDNAWFPELKAKWNFNIYIYI